MPRRPQFATSAVDRFLSSHLSNAQYNRLVWTVYPALRRLAGRAPRGQVVGEEWGLDPRDVDEVVEEFVAPYVTDESVVAGIGVGGGRIAARVAPRVRELYGFDISRTMLRRAREALREHPNVRYVKLDRPEELAAYEGRFDFVYAFDVFLHLDLHVMWRYFAQFARILRDDGKVFLHTANLAAPDGWRWFSEQRGYSVGGAYFVSPEIVGILAERAGLEAVTSSEPDPRNSYLYRDYLVVLRKSSAPR